MSIPSLALKPIGYKAGKLYSQLPTSGVGDFTVSRASTATRVNKSGFLETVVADVPRLDYSDGGCPVLLTEPQSTNLIKNSEYLTDFSGAATNTFDATIVNPEGALGVARVSNLLGAVGDVFQDSSVITPSETYSGSLYYKGEGVNIGKTITIYVKRTLGSISQSQLVRLTLTNTWQRVEVTHTFLADNTTAAIIIKNDSDTADEALFWGAQFENLPYATSYIKTEGTEITRAADVVANAGNTSTFNSNAGVIFVETRVFENDGQSYISLNDGSGSNTLQVRFVNGQVLFRVLNSGVGVGSAVTHNMDLTTNHKIACRYDNASQTFTMFVDGVSVGVKQTGVTTLAVLSSFDFDSGGGSTEFYGETKQIQIFKTALTDTEIREQLMSFTSFNAMAKYYNYTII